MASKYDLMINIGGKLNGSLANATSGANKALSGMQRSAGLVKTAIVGALGYVGVSSVINFTKSCIAAANESENVTKQLETVLASTRGISGMTAESATALATSLSLVTTYEDDTILSTENLLLTFTQISSSVMPQVTEAALNMSTALGQNTSSSAQMLGKALNDPIAGIAKLTKVGVTFTEEQKKQITAMQQAGDIAGAQKVMLAELETEFGNSARAAATTSEGRLMQLNNAWSNVKETIGTKVLPVITTVITAIATRLPQITATVDSIMAHLQPTFDFIKNTVVPGIVNVVSNVLVPAISGAYTVIMGIVGFVSDHAVIFETVAGAILAVVAAMLIWKGVTTAISAVSKAFTAVQLALNVVMAANPIVLIVLAIVALVAAFVVLWNKCDAFRNFWIGLWDGIKKVFTTVFNVICGFFKKWGLLILLFVAPFIAVPLLVVKHWDTIKAFMAGVWEGIKGVFSSVGAWFSGIFTGAWEGIKGAFSAVGSFFGGIWATITGIFTTIGTTIGNAIGGAFKAVVNAIIGFAENMINGFINSINLAISLINAIPGVSISPLTPLAIPRLAEGGIVQHGNGGILANIGEGRYDEAVIPLKNGKGLGGGSNVTYAPVQNFYGPVSKSDVEAANAESFAQFKAWYKKMKDDERRKSLAPA